MSARHVQHDGRTSFHYVYDLCALTVCVRALIMANYNALQPNGGKKMEKELRKGATQAQPRLMNECERRERTE